MGITNKVRILITGASGTGTSTLAKLLAYHYGISWFDLDDFYWISKEPKYTVKRSLEKREQLLATATNQAVNWIISGSLLYWGNFLVQSIDLVVFLTVPTKERLKRIIAREISIFGKKALEKGGSREQLFQNFISWAESYDSGKPPKCCKKLHDQWSRNLHDQWLLKLPCPILNIDGNQNNQERLKIVIEKFNLLTQLHNSIHNGFNSLDQCYTWNMKLT